jgi:hypothetical protein
MKLIMENWKKFVEESNEPSGPPWSEPAQVLAALAQQKYEPIGTSRTDVEDYIATMLTSAPVRQWEVADWISTLDGEWIYHPDNEEAETEKRAQREKDPEYRARVAKRNRQDAEYFTALDSVDWETTNLGHPMNERQLESLKEYQLITENWRRFLNEEPEDEDLPDEDEWEEEPLPDENDEVVEYILNATRVGQSPDEITQGLIEAGLTEEQALAALADAFEQGLRGDREVEVDLGEAALGRTTQSDVRDSAFRKANTQASVAPGVSDTEREVFTRLQQQATAAAKVGNIAQGTALDKANKLSAIWTAMIAKFRKK